ncbi:hypothetical protein, partial [Bacillus mycoides]|uniref:hypothetical protein n=1 Tax=Bacillus mycoides TaxID=1405 RepID=UPI002E20C1EA|nr:hypothetical protein [Bacillus mycoides]
LPSKYYYTMLNYFVHLCWSSVGCFVVHVAINKKIIAITTPKSPCLSHMDKAEFEAIAKKINITVYLLNLITNNLSTEPYSRKFYHFLVS